MVAMHDKREPLNCLAQVRFCKSSLQDLGELPVGSSKARLVIGIFQGTSENFEGASVPLEVPLQATDTSPCLLRKSKTRVPVCQTGTIDSAQLVSDKEPESQRAPKLYLN